MPRKRRRSRQGESHAMALAEALTRVDPWDPSPLLGQERRPGPPAPALLALQSGPLDPFLPSVRRHRADPGARRPPGRQPARRLHRDRQHPGAPPVQSDPEGPVSPPLRSHERRTGQEILRNLSGRRSGERFLRLHRPTTRAARGVPCPPRHLPVPGDLLVLVDPLDPLLQADQPGLRAPGSLGGQRDQVRPGLPRLRPYHPHRLRPAFPGDLPLP